MTSNSKLAPAGIARHVVLLLCPLLAQAVACDSRPDESTNYVTAAATGDEPCIDSRVHELTTGRSCSERAPAACAPGTDPESIASATLSTLLSQCFLNENRVHVELEQGCVTRFGLLLEPPGAVDCIATRLAADRYDCLGDLDCGVGEVSTIR
jgi:hypothetical protein